MDPGQKCGGLLHSHSLAHQVEKLEDRMDVCGDFWSFRKVIQRQLVQMESQFQQDMVTLRDAKGFDDPRRIDRFIAICPFQNHRSRVMARFLHGSYHQELLKEVLHVQVIATKQEHHRDLEGRGTIY